MPVNKRYGPGNKRVAIYARLSVNENGERDESLETQCQLLETYVEQNIHGPVGFYVDSDISGTCFDRPGLTRLVKDIKDGLISTILVKDLSRLGRNNGETLTFLDFLREKNIRLISLGDNYDSFEDDDEIIGIKTWVNEHYARDISKKVRYNLRKKMQKGQFLGRPPFGYLKSTVDKNKLVVDERYRGIIRKIFELYTSGWGYRALAEYVQTTGIPTPSQDKGYVHTPKSRQWNEQHIRRIITNRVYCGDTVQGVSEKISFKSKKTRRVSSEKWIIVPDTHEAIISRELFALAQGVRRRRWLEGQGRKKSVKTGPHLFTGFIMCAGCGSHHTFRQRGKRPAGYVCGKYNRLGRKGCTSHHVSEKKLVQYILNDVRTLAAGVSFHDRLIREYRQSNNTRDAIVEKISNLEKEVTAKNRQLQAAYLDKIRGVISEQLFLDTKVLVEKELKTLTDRMNGLKDDLKNTQKCNIEVTINKLGLELLDENDIDRGFLERFVKKIIVIDDNEIISEDVKKKYGMDLRDKEQLRVINQGTGGLIIFYNLCPNNCKRREPALSS